MAKNTFTDYQKWYKDIHGSYEEFCQHFSALTPEASADVYGTLLLQEFEYAQAYWRVVATGLPLEDVSTVFPTVQLSKKEQTHWQERRDAFVAGNYLPTLQVRRLMETHLQTLARKPLIGKTLRDITNAIGVMRAVQLPGDVLLEAYETVLQYLLSTILPLRLPDQAERDRIARLLLDARGLLRGHIATV